MEPISFEYYSVIGPVSTALLDDTDICPKTVTIVDEDILYGNELKLSAHPIKH